MSGPKHREVYQQLLAEIEAGKYDQSLKLPSEGQLVKRFNVSRPTAARALRELETQGLVYRKAGSGNYLKPKNRPSHAAQQVGLLVPELGSIEVFESICGEFASLARIHNLGVVWGGGSNYEHSTEDLTIKEAENLCDSLISKPVTGVLFAPLEGGPNETAANQRISQKLSAARVPFILLDRDLAPFPNRSPYDLVTLDNFRAGYIVAEHFLQQGVRRLAFFSRYHSADSIDLRRAGIAAALAANSTPITGPFAFEGDPLDTATISHMVREAGCQALICANDKTAAQVLQSLNRLEIATPGQVQIAGFDDFRLASLLPVPLTTVRQPPRELAQIAFQALQERMSNPSMPPRIFLANPRLIVRQSSLVA